MAINRERARAAGYTDEEINAFEAEENTKNPPAPAMATAQVEAMEPPPPEQTPIPEIDKTASTMAAVGAGAGQLAENVKNAAIPIGEGYLAYKGIQGMRDLAGAKQAAAQAQQAHTNLQQQKFASQQAKAAGMRPPGSAPTATAPPAQPTAMNFLERMAGLARTYAPLARGATGVAAAVTPGNAGQNYGAHFPQTGPQAGREINPATGAPWTAQELQQYAQFTK